MNIRDYYDQRWYGGGYIFEESVYTASQQKYVQEHLQYERKRILDVGCGNGRIGSLFSKDNTVVGIDVSLAAVEAARSKGLTGIIGSIDNRLPFKDETFDAVLLIEVIEHVFDPISLLKDICRIMKPKGTLICTTPNAGVVLNRLYFLFKGEFKDFTARENVLNEGFPFTEHIRPFSPRCLRKLLSECGFAIQSMDHWFPEHFTSAPFNKFNWIARLIKIARLHKVFPDLFLVNICVTALKPDKVLNG